jgi:myo-inositol-1-phosphate synthase
LRSQRFDRMKIQIGPEEQMKTKIDIAPATGRLGVLIVGNGGVTSTFIAGVELAKKELIPPYGSRTQMSRIRVGSRTDEVLIKDFVDLAELNDLAFAVWDLNPDSTYEAAVHANIVEAAMLEHITEELHSIKPMSAVFERRFADRLKGDNIKSGGNKIALAEAVIEDIEQAKQKLGCDRLVMVWAASTEILIERSEIHESVENFERAMIEDHEDISPSMIYAYAAVSCGVPFINGAPGLTCDIPAIVALAHRNKAPLCGKDFKTGQTWLKTVIAPAILARALGVEGWNSSNILGNRDGEVLDNPDNNRTKTESKLGVLEQILSAEKDPMLYGDLAENHKVDINFYKPCGDDKEGYDRLDLKCWLGKKMTLRVIGVYPDSNLASGLLLDLVLLMDWAKRAELVGIQEWLSWCFKCPQTAEGLPPLHDFFAQILKFENFLRHVMGEDLINHLGLEYYEDSDH